MVRCATKQGQKRITMKVKEKEKKRKKTQKNRELDNTCRYIHCTIQRKDNTRSGT